jgi:predicted transcriptional regulator
MPLEILRTILYKHNHTVVKFLYEHIHLSNEEIQSRAKLSRKQVYTSIQRLKSVNAVRKYNNEYILTEITMEILKYLNVIEEIEDKKLTYKMREIIETDKKLTAEEKQNIIRNLKL